MEDKDDIQKELDKVYEQIGSALTPENLDELLERATELERLLNPKPTPMSFEEWERINGCDARNRYNFYKEEYGDAVQCFESQYVEQMYREYLEDFDRNWYFYN